MPVLARASAALVANLLLGDGGLNASWRDLDCELPSVVIGNRSYELEERAVRVAYPRVYVYCVRVENILQEKFTRFSGRLHMVVEVRVSDDRVENIESALQSCVDSIADVLERNRGDIGSGFVLSGKYEVLFDPIHKGGRNYIQTAKLQFALDMSRS